MDRRTFTQLFTLAAGSLGLMQAAGQAQEQDADDQRNAKTGNNLNARGPSSKAVNVEDLRQLAKAALPKASFDYIATGSADEITLRENVAAFQRLRVFPPLMKGVSDADLSTTALGQKIQLPVLLAPVAVQRMYHPQGGLAAARAAAGAGTIYGVSSSVGNSVEEIAAAGNGPKWFQLYVPKDRAVARTLVQRVERAGYKAIIVTVDLGEWKDADQRNRFSLPKEMLVKHLRDVGYDQITDRMSYEAVSEFNANAWDLSLSWEFFDWLRGITKLPILIKGVLRPEDARKAVSMGLDGIVVSNHGGRRLDGMPATIDVLPSIVEAVGGKAEIYMDGGVRRGTDVLKALAFGARAVLIGRPYAWALAADGEAGVARVIKLFREELLNAMVATGCRKLSEIERSLIA
ncbi:MAG: alpha-hydroxy-acid oxidizing enzyme [Planctomycetaceae bacterium]|nr:alpha-hydroxy-acid oxidizing enzyme [Planctomycetaceae bacterium]